MTTATIDDLLRLDIDDLTTVAGDLPPDARNSLLASAAQALSRPTLQSRLKLLRFVQALAATAEPSLTHATTEAVAVRLITEAHADDPTQRLAAIRGLAVLALGARDLSLALTHPMLATFEHARIDSLGEIRDFANEILSPENPVFRRLISLEAAAAGAGTLDLFLETLIDHANAILVSEPFAGGDVRDHDKKRN
jgi:hypothetical protein